MVGEQCDGCLRRGRVEPGLDEEAFAVACGAGAHRIEGADQVQGLPYEVGRAVGAEVAGRDGMEAVVVEVLDEALAKGAQVGRQPEQAELVQ